MCCFGCNHLNDCEGFLHVDLTFGVMGVGYELMKGPVIGWSVDGFWSVDVK